MSLYHDQERQRAKREAARENSSRFASQTFTYRSSGSGNRVVQTPFMFDCKFLNEPALSDGHSIVRIPDLKHWRMPVCKVSVVKWVTEVNPTGPTFPFYVGAYLNVNVQIDPINFLRTDGSNLTFLEDQLENYTVNSIEWIGVKKSIAEAQEAIYLNAHPPQAIIDHFITFSEVGMKALPGEILDAMYADPELPARPVKYN